MVDNVVKPIKQKYHRRGHCGEISLVNIKLQVCLRRDEELILLVTAASTGTVLRQEGDIVLGGPRAALSSGDHYRSAIVCLLLQTVFNYVDQREESTLETQSFG